jgi:hypothetical protein
VPDFFLWQKKYFFRPLAILAVFLRVWGKSKKIQIVSQTRGKSRGIGPPEKIFSLLHKIFLPNTSIPLPRKIYQKKGGHLFVIVLFLKNTCLYYAIFILWNPGLVCSTLSHDISSLAAATQGQF